MANDDAHERVIATARPERPIDPIRDGARRTHAGIDSAGVGIGTVVRLDTFAHPFGSAAKTVEIGVTDDRADGTDAFHEIRGHHLGARAMLRLRGENEARIGGEARVLLVIVMIDPSGQTGS